MDITLDDVKAFLKDNKDEDGVKEFLLSLAPEPKITAEQVSEFLATPDGEKLVQPIADARVTAAVNKRDKYWKEEALESEVKKRVAAEVLKMNPKQDPAEARYKELTDRIEKSEREAAAEKLKRQVIEKAAEIGVDPFYIENYFPSSLEENELFMQKIKEHEKKITEKAINDLIASKNFIPNGGKPKSTLKVDVAKLSQAEINELEATGKLDEILAGK